MGLNVVNASVAEPVLRLGPLSFSQTESLLEKCSLHPGLLESATGLIPLHAAEEFVFHTQHCSGDSCFAFNAVERMVRLGGADVANIPLRGATVALDGVQGFAAAMDGVLTGTRFWSCIDGKSFWLLRTPGTTQWSDSWPLVLYNLSIILSGIRSLLGADVRPSAVVVARETGADVMPEALSGIPLTLGAPVTGLAFDRTLLARAVRARAEPPMNDGMVYRSLSQVDSDTIGLCLRGLLASEATDRLADRAARAFGVSRRSYQRHLQRLGTSHRVLADNARLSVAMDLLADKAWAISQIALELGYSHPGDFTRFIRRRTGLSPTELRHGMAQRLT